MDIYKITRRTATTRHDVYDAAVVYAENAYNARCMHPSDGKNILSDQHVLEAKQGMDTWPTDERDVQSKRVGQDHTRLTQGVILACFIAG